MVPSAWYSGGRGPDLLAGFVPEDDNRAVARRIHVSQVSVGEVLLDDREAHHVRDVLRLKEQTAVEAFDDVGNIGLGILKTVAAGRVSIAVESIQPREVEEFNLVIAAAVPKAARADWMVEKLSELGVNTLIPLATDRSVSLPEGKNKLQRWVRLAEEAAKQSHRRGVMHIESLTSLPETIKTARLAGDAWCLSTGPGTVPIAERIAQMTPGTLTLFIGPEGGWTVDEVTLFEQSGIPGVSLTRTILRIETAAIAAAAIVASLQKSGNFATSSK